VIGVAVQVRRLQAQRYRYQHLDMAHLDEQLAAATAAGARNKLVVTDGVFSMDGDIAPLKELLAVARKHDAQVAVDECHATGVLGATGRGTDELAGVLGQVRSPHARRRSACSSCMCGAPAAVTSCRCHARRWRAAATRLRSSAVCEWLPHHWRGTATSAAQCASGCPAIGRAGRVTVGGDPHGAWQAGVGSRVTGACGFRWM
jgi:hypothetical protein